MAADIFRLEQDWLQAETIADQARSAAMNADRQLECLQLKGDGDQIRVLISSVEAAKARFQQAEQSACDAFDRLWQAKSQGQLNA